MSTGLVTTITTDWRGDTLAADVLSSATVLPVSSVVDFDEDGGWLVVGDSAPMEYLTADETTLTVALAGTVGAGYELGLPVDVWDPTVGTEGSRVVEYVATVELHDGSGSPDAVIPHSMVPTSGVDFLIGASVRIVEADDGEWFIGEVLGREPQLDGDLLDLEALSLTAEVVRTTVGGNRVEVLADGAVGKVLFYSGDPDETGPASIAAQDPGSGPPYLTLISGVTSAEPNQASIGLQAGATAAQALASVSARKINLGLVAGTTVTIGLTTTSTSKLNVHGEIHSLWNGGIFDDSYAGGGGTTASINDNGRVIRTSSSERYKRDIETLTLTEAKKLLDLRPVVFRWLADMDMGDATVPGLIAEELDAAGAGLWVTYDSEGRPDGVRYAELSAALILLAQDQERRLARIEAALNITEDGA